MKRKRNLFAIIAMVLCLGLFSGCAKQEEEGEAVDPTLIESIKANAQEYLQGMAQSDEGIINVVIQQYQDEDNPTMANSLETWLNTKNEVGEFVQFNDVSLEHKDDQYVVTAKVSFEKRPMDITVIYNRKLMMTNLEFAPEYTLGENMGRAAVHTLIGMGTVFIVLIFISLVIGCFKYINQWEKNQKAKADSAVPAPVPAPAPAPSAPVLSAVPEEEGLVDDLELVAVITAAIAASANTSADGLVVRSIRRKPGAKWNRA